MFCPQCKNEYRPGITRCAECDVDLVDQLSGTDLGRSADEGLASGRLKKVWAQEDEAECMVVCAKLREAGIPFRVSQHAEQQGKMKIGHYVIGVPPESESAANEILERRQQEFENEDEMERAMELPAEDGLAGAETEEEDDNREPGDGGSGDAQIEVWSGINADQAEMIEASLKEIGIRAKLEDEGRGKRKVSVAARHEARAKEIVKEILEGKPE